jgi:hypothetical protein
LSLQRQGIYHKQRDLHPVQLHGQRGSTYVSLYVLGPFRVPLLTYPLVAQRWQKKACNAPFRESGPLTSRVGTALVVIAGVSVGLRFLSRWLIQDSNIGWDDWTILLSFILLIPSTIMLKMSSCSNEDHSPLLVLTGVNSGRISHGQRHLDRPLRRNNDDVQGLFTLIIALVCMYNS